MTSIATEPETVTEPETNMSVQCELMQEICISSIQCELMHEVCGLPSIPLNEYGNTLVNDETPTGQCYIARPRKNIHVGIITWERNNKVFRYLSGMTKRGWVENRENIVNAFNKSVSLVKKEERSFAGVASNDSSYYKNKCYESNRVIMLLEKRVINIKNAIQKKRDLIDKLKKENENLKKIKEDDEGDLNNMAETLTGMFKKYTNLESRQEWANNEKLRETGLEQYFCTDCGDFEVFEEKVKTKKCIHGDCPGMCSGCFDIKNPEGFEVCSCCDKKQEFECPICYIKRPSEFIVNGKNCTHNICCVCYTKAIRGGNKIDNCPMCRKEF